MTLLPLPFALETAVEHQIVADPEWQRGVLWGTPRPGHPEGQVLHHIQDVLQNVDAFFGSHPQREQLRQIALIHDSFKQQARERVPKQSHGLVAREFAEKYLEETAVLLVIQHHDDAYKAYRFLQTDPQCAQMLVEQLIQRLDQHLNLFLQFYLCDNKTGNKTADHYHWFLTIVKE